MQQREMRRMNTPIIDFVEQYKKTNISRLHMPGHKGFGYLGCEPLDITEINGADALYEADGIIAESETNASAVFGTGKTLYSTEGSSQCIRAMLYLAMSEKKTEDKPILLAARNVHKSFIHAAALLDLDVEWMHSETKCDSICTCMVSAEGLEKQLCHMNKKPFAVYVTSPDYIGGQLDIKGIAEVCHRHDCLCIVDNAHGAYLKFLPTSLHPIDLGADLCCDSAHKTLPLTGGAYLHMHKNVSKTMMHHAKNAMALFGSTSPSYLTLISLDYCNLYLSDSYGEKLSKTIQKLEDLRIILRKQGWKVEITDPLKLTVQMPLSVDGKVYAEHLRMNQVECEYADSEYIVCMFTPENTDNDYQKVIKAFGINKNKYDIRERLEPALCEKKMSIREAIFAKHCMVPVAQSLGKICGTPMVSCPPAIPIVVSGEVINEEAIKRFEFYDIDEIDIVED